LVHIDIRFSVCSSYSGHIYQLQPTSGFTNLSRPTATPSAFHFSMTALASGCFFTLKVRRWVRVSSQTGRNFSCVTKAKFRAAGERVFSSPMCFNICVTRNMDRSFDKAEKDVNEGSLPSLHEHYSHQSFAATTAMRAISFAPLWLVIIPFRTRIGEDDCSNSLLSYLIVS